MRRSGVKFGSIVLAAAAALFLTSCAAAGSRYAGLTTNADSVAARAVEPDHSVFVASIFAPAVSVYSADNRRDRGPVCQIGPVSLPGGLYVTQGGILLVLMFAGGNVVASFGADCGSGAAYSTATYSDSAGTPNDLVADGDVLYLSNQNSTTKNPVSVPAYHLKKTGNLLKPFKNLTISKTESGVSVAVDNHHNLFWAVIDNDTGQGEVFKFAHGQIPAHLLQGTVIGTDTPGNLMIDASDNLLVVDQTKAQIDVIAPPYDRKPIAQIALQQTARRCVLSSDDTRIYCLDYINGAVDVYGYPGGSYLYSFNQGINKEAEPIGLAFH